MERWSFDVRREGTKPGHRVYYTKHGCEAVVLLAGGDKCTQATDINMLQSSRESQVPSHATTTEARFEGVNSLEAPVGPGQLQVEMDVCSSN